VSTGPTTATKIVGGHARPNRDRDAQDVELVLAKSREGRVEGTRGGRQDPKVRGRGRPARTWRGFEKARDFASSLGLSTRAEWRMFARSHARPVDVPANPARTYRDHGWNGWADFLGSARGTQRVQAGA
jgi:hypothetical protein